MFTQRRSIIFFILFTSLRIICGVWYGDLPPAPIRYVAAIKEDVNFGFNLCSAAIIGSHLLLSHTPCLYKLRGKIVVVAGAVDVTHPGIVSDIKNVIPHEHYDFLNETNPLALVQTISKIIGPNSEIINITKNPWADYKTCKFAAYGYRVYKEKHVWWRNITTGVLHTKAITGLKYKPATCGCLKTKPELIKKSELICVLQGQAGLCIGDYGAPLVCETSEGSVVVAVAANFQACESYDEYKAYMDEYRQFSCGDPAKSTEMYTFVYPYVEWIKNEVKKISKIRVSFSSANRLLQIPPLSLLLFIRTINYLTIL